METTNQNVLIECSEQLNEVATALADFQAIVPVMPKDCEVDFRDRNSRRVNYKYTNLDTILTVIRPLLGKHGLSVIQAQEVVSGRSYVSTMLLHKSGQFIRSRLLIVETPKDMKALGTVLTYAKRYALSALLGIASDEDLDNATNQDGAAIAVKVSEQDIPLVNKNELAQLRAALADNVDIHRGLLEHFEINCLEDLPQCYFHNALQGIEQQKSAKLAAKGA